MSNLLTLTSAQLIKAANIKDSIEALTKELNGLLGSSAPVQAAKLAKKGVISATGKSSQSAKMKAYWAAKKSAKTTPAIVKPVAAKPAKKGVISAAGKARIVAAQKLRWAKIKAAKANTAPKAVVKAVVKAKPVLKPAKKKFVMSAAAKAKISAAAKARWAAKKAGAKK